jgi:hypothetical protein
VKSHQSAISCRKQTPVDSHGLSRVSHPLSLPTDQRRPGQGEAVAVFRFGEGIEIDRPAAQMRQYHAEGRASDEPSS